MQTPGRLLIALRLSCLVMMLACQTRASVAQELIDAAQAQDLDAVLPALTLNDATNLAIADSPRIREISWKIRQAQAEGQQQSSLVNPQIGTVINEIGNEGQGGQYGFFLQRNLVRNNRVEQAQNVYQWKSKSLESLGKIIQRQIAQQVADQFIQIEASQRGTVLGQRKLQGLQNIRKIAETLMKGGEIAPIELNQIELELEQVRQQLRQSMVENEQARQLLETYIGTKLPRQLDFDFDKEMKLILESTTQRNHDIQQHPAIEQLDNRIKEYHWRVQLAESQQTPDWQLQSSVNFDTASNDFFGGFQLNVPWMIHHRNEGQIKSATSQGQALNEQKKLVTLKLQRKLIELSAKRVSLIAQLNSITSRVIPLVDKNSVELTRLFQAGETSYKQVMSAYMDRYRWRELKLQLSKELLSLEVKTETLTLD